MLECRAKTNNARIGAIVMALSALALLILTHTAEPLAPLRILTLGAAAFGAWAFCDEMGLRKPLNRAGFIAFCIAVASKIQVMLGVPADVAGRYYLLYAAFLLLAMLFWSVAFLHRPSMPKAVGALGAAVSLSTITVIIVGHLVVGVGALAGLQSLLAASDGSATPNLFFVALVERMFGLWGYVTAWALWRGHIHDSPPPAVSPGY